MISIIIFTHLSFSYQCELMVFHWSLSDSKSPHVSKTLFCILVDLNNAVVWRVSSRPFISKSSSSSSGTNHLVTVPRARITIDITVTFMFHRFFSYLARSTYLSLSSFSFSFTLCSAGTAKSIIRLILFFCCC